MFCAETLHCSSPDRGRSRTKRPAPPHPDGKQAASTAVATLSTDGAAPRMNVTDPAVRARLQLTSPTSAKGMRQFPTKASAATLKRVGPYKGLNASESEPPI